MTPKAYKQKLKAVLQSFASHTPEEEKLAQLDAFRRQPGVAAHLRRISLAFLLGLLAPSLTYAQVADTLIPATGDLATKFNDGSFEFADVISYIVYLINFLIYLAGGLAVLFVVIGGYRYMASGVSDDKDSGKKTIMAALGGLALAALSWVIVNLVQIFVTSA